MNRRSFLNAAVVLGAQSVVPGAATGGSAAGTASGASESSRQIAKAAGAAMAMQRRDWEQGILAQAFLETGDRQRMILLTKAAMAQRTEDGRLAVVISGGPTDPAMGGAAYDKAAEWTGDKQIQAAVDGLLEWILRKAPRSTDGTLYHVFDAPQMWSDGLNGAPPFLAAMGHYDEAIAQIDGHRKRLWNPEKKLLAHIWDEGKGTLADPAFWGGGNGWGAAGLARVWRSLPATRQSDRDHVAQFAREIIDGCLQHQRADGLFHNVVDDPNSFVETNLAQMLAFAAFEGMRAGWLPASYRSHAQKMRAAARGKMDEFGLVQGVCGAPNFDRPGISTEAQAFCMMMEAAGK